MQTRKVKGIKERTVFFSTLPMLKKIAVIEKMLDHSRDFGKWSSRAQSYEWACVLCTYKEFIRDAPYRYTYHE